MDTFSIIVGVVIVIAYIAIAIMVISDCDTTAGTICATIAAIGIGALLAHFIEYVIAVAIIVLAFSLLGAIFG